MLGPVVGSSSGASGAPASTSQDLRKVNFMLSWVPDTNHIGVYVARNKGFYAEEGLDVGILAVAQAGAEQAVNNGLADFALSNMSNIGSLSLQDVHLTQVLQVQRRPSAIWCSLASNAAITRPKDLDGKVFATFGANEDSAIVKRMIQGDGGRGEFDSVTVGTSTFHVLQAGKADFGGFYSTWEGVEAQLKGPKLNCFEGEKYGVPGNPNEIGVITKADTAKKDPAFVKAFTQATKRGYEYAYAHPDEAGEILVAEAKKDGMEVDPALAKASMKFIVDGKFWGDPAKIADGSFALGTADVAGAQAYYDFLAKAGGTYQDAKGNPVSTAPKASELATDQFLK